MPEAVASDAPGDVAPPPAPVAVSAAAAPEKEDAPAPRRSCRGNTGIIKCFDPSPAPARAVEAATLSPALPTVVEGTGGGAAADGVKDPVVAAPEAEDTRVGATATSNVLTDLLTLANDNERLGLGSASANAGEGVNAEAAVDIAEDDNLPKTAKDLISIIKKKEPCARLAGHFNPIFPADNVPSGYSEIKPYTSRLLKDRFPDQKIARIDDVKADGNCLFNSCLVHMNHEQSQGRLCLTNEPTVSDLREIVKKEAKDYIVHNLFSKEDEAESYARTHFHPEAKDGEYRGLNSLQVIPHHYGMPSVIVDEIEGLCIPAGPTGTDFSQLLPGLCTPAGPT